MKLWRITGIMWIVVFLIMISIIMLRQRDGAGIYQTPQLKIINLIILGVFIGMVALVYIIWYIILKKNSNI